MTWIFSGMSMMDMLRRVELTALSAKYPMSRSVNTSNGDIFTIFCSVSTAG